MRRWLLEPLLTRPIQILPPLPFLDHGLEVFLEDDGVLGGVFDDGSGHAGGEVGGGEGAVAEVAGQG